MVFPDCILDSMKKPDNKPWRKLLLQIFPTGLWAPTVHCVSNPHFFPPAASSLYTPPRTAERARFDRSLGSMSRKQASVCWRGTWAVAPPSGKQKGGYQHIAWCSVGCRKDIQAKEFCKKEQEAWNRYVRTRSEKALSIAELTKGISTLKVVEIEVGDCSFKCKKSNTKFQRTWKCKKMWNQQMLQQSSSNLIQMHLPD